MGPERRSCMAVSCLSRNNAAVAACNGGERHKTEVDTSLLVYLGKCLSCDQPQGVAQAVRSSLLVETRSYEGHDLAFDRSGAGAVTCAATQHQKSQVYVRCPSAIFPVFRGLVQIWGMTVSR